MNSYILLRNNKETGPFSLAALQQTGLKPTDLIWIECQSMNWRHPYEINELKALLVDDSNSMPDNINQQVPLVVSKTPEITNEPLVEKKLVYVELPIATNPVNEKKVSVIPDSDLADIKKYSGITDIEEPNKDISSSDTSIKYSRPLDEIKEMYVKNLEQKERSQKGIAFVIPKKFRQPLIYLFLLLAGAGVTLFFKKTERSKEIISPQSIQQPIPTPVSEPVAEEQTPVTDIIPVNTEQQPITPDGEQIISSGEKPKDATIKKSIPRQQDDKLTVKQAVDRSEKNNTSSIENTKTTPPTPENIHSKLTIVANEYVVGSFGGIRNLEMTLQNNSSYLLDKVAVTIEYLNPEGMIIKTENIYFHSIYAGEKETLAVKKTNRGVKITYRITKIDSKDIGSTTAAF